MTEEVDEGIHVPRTAIPQRSTLQDAPQLAPVQSVLAFQPTVADVQLHMDKLECHLQVTLLSLFFFFIPFLFKIQPL